MHHFKHEENIIIILIKVMSAEVKFVAHIFVFS